MMKDNKYTAKGYMDFFCDKGILFQRYDEEYFLDRFMTENRKNYNAEQLEAAAQNYIKNLYEENFTYTIFHEMSGLDFLKDVEDGCFIDYDGTLCQVYVEGFVTNLGLRHRGINQGEFKLSGDAWKRLCLAYDVKVNWANK